MCHTILPQIYGHINTLYNLNVHCLKPDNDDDDDDDDDEANIGDYFLE